MEKAPELLLLKIFAISLPSQPVLGHHLGFHIFSTMAFLGAEHFLYSWAVFGLDNQLLLHSWPHLFGLFLHGIALLFLKENL